MTATTIEKLAQFWTEKKDRALVCPGNKNFRFLPTKFRCRP